MRLPKLFLACLVAAIAIVSTGSKAHADAMIQQLVTTGINTLKDQDWEVYIPVTPGGNPGGAFMKGDEIITFVLYTTMQNANGTMGIGSTNFGSPTGGSTVFGNFYQLTDVTVTTLNTPTDVQNGVADISATSVASIYENAAYTPTNNSNTAGTEFNPNRLSPGGVAESDTTLITRLMAEATSGNLVLTASSNQFLSEDVSSTLAGIPTLGNGETSDFGFKETSDPGHVGFKPNAVSTTATDGDEAGGSVNFGPTPTDFAGTTLSLLNQSSNNNSAFPIVTATTLQFQGVPTPEPGSMLIWAGLALAGGVYQRRRR